MTALLTARDVTKRFPGGIVALDRVSLEVEDGEVLALLGAGGAGKTTLLRIVAGLERPDAGEVRILGASPTLGPGRAPVSLMFQNEALFPHLSVAGNVAYGLGRRPPGDAGELVDGLLVLVGLRGKGSLVPAKLTPVERRRLAFARALARRPRLLLLDAPTSGLDDLARTALHVTLAEVQKSTGIAYLLATDNPDEAQRLADRIAVLDDGTIAEVGTPARLRERPTSRAAARLVARMNLMNGRVARSGEVTVVHIEGVGPRPFAGHAPDGVVTLGVAPAAIRVSREARPRATAGFVRGFPFLAGRRCVLIEAAGTEIVAQLPSVPLREGDAVWFDWAEDALVVLAG